MPKNNFSPMMAALTKPKMPQQPKRAGRQFGTVASGGNVAGSKPFSDTAIKANPSVLAVLSANQYGGKLGK